MIGRIPVVILACLSLCACASVRTKDAPGNTDLPTADIGVATVTDVFQRSDIAVLPPSQEHVIWRRTPGAVTGRAVAVSRAEEPPVTRAAVAIEEPVATTPAAATHVGMSPAGTWPLLAEDGNPKSQTGLVDMCRARNQGCTSVDCYRELEPCQHPEAYDCVEGKALDYCVKKVGMAVRVQPTAGGQATAVAAARVESSEALEYRRTLASKIKAAWIRPTTTPRGVRCTLTLTQRPDGSLMSAEVADCNGDDALRRSVADAAKQASPLPMPSNPALFEPRLTMTFAPDEDPTIAQVRP